MSQGAQDQKPAPPGHDAQEPPHVMSSERWERLKAEMKAQQKKQK